MRKRLEYIPKSGTDVDACRRTFGEREGGRLPLDSFKQPSYSRGVLTSRWMDRREEEPKDYDLSKDPHRSLFKFTYNRTSQLTDLAAPMSMTRSATEEAVELKDRFTHQPIKKQLINIKNLHSSVLQRNEISENDYKRLFPKTRKFCSNYATTTIEHFKPPSTSFKNSCKVEMVEDAPDWTIANKRMISQFTDVFDHRREGRNTWVDETGLYHNRICRLQCPYYALRPTPYETW